MNRAGLSLLQRRWIKASFLDIHEMPEAYGIPDLKEEKDTLVSLILQDMEQKLQCRVSLQLVVEEITELMKSLNKEE